MAATSLLLVRDALQELFGGELAAVGVPLLWGAPVDAEDLSELRTVWWENEVEATVAPYTTQGLVETYEMSLLVQCLPEDGDVTARDAAEKALELIELLYEATRDNRRPVDTSGGWDVVIDWAGHQLVTGRTERPSGFGASWIARIGVEATRCS